MAGGLVGALLQTKFRRVEAGLHKRADGRLQAGLRSCRLLHVVERHPGRVRDRFRLRSAAQDGSPPALNWASKTPRGVGENDGRGEETYPFAATVFLSENIGN